MNSIIQKTKDITFGKNVKCFTKLFRIYEACYQGHGQECQHVCAVEKYGQLKMELLKYSDIVELSNRLGHQLPCYHFNSNFPKEDSEPVKDKDNSEKGLLLREMLRDEC
jgi:hypothetical protein